MKKLIPCLLAIGLGASAALAGSNQLFHRRSGHPNGSPPGGGGGTPTGSLYACDASGSGVCADHANGQTFVQWTDAAQGLAGASYRYRVYESPAPLNSSNCTSATLVASWIFNNSGQLVGGNPDPSIGLGMSYTQANRQANTAASASATQVNNPMAKIPDAQTGVPKTLPYYSGLQVRTVPSNRTEYYCVMSTDTTDSNPLYIGAVGPIAETLAAQKPVLYAHRTSGTHFITNDGSGLPTGTQGHPMVVYAHASSSNGGSAIPNTGDYWEWFGDPTMGWQDGRQAVFSVGIDGPGGVGYPGLSTRTLVYGHRDTVWKPDGGASVGTTTVSTFETGHNGLGFIPNPLVPTVGSVGSGRFYPMTANAIKAELNWIIGYYGPDTNKLHWTGVSMGSYGGAITGVRMTNPQFASVWLRYPRWRYELDGPGGWCGAIWTASQPFKPTIGAPPNVCGTNAAALLMQDGSTYQSYMDILDFVSANPAQDLPFIAWGQTKDDLYFPQTLGDGSFKQEIDMVSALQQAHRGHAFCWAMGAHGQEPDSALDYDNSPGSPVATAYKKDKFALNLPYLAFDTSSIDDTPGVGAWPGVFQRSAYNISQGDTAGCINAGFTWSVVVETSSAVGFSVGNSWLGLQQPADPQATVTVGTSSLGTGAGAAMTVDNGAAFISTNGGKSNLYFNVGDTEIMQMSVSGNTLTPTGRGQLNTTARTHAAGEVIQQYRSDSSGPRHGPFSTMTVNVTPRRLQSFHPAVGTTLDCSINPSGGSLYHQNVTVDSNGLITIPVIINQGGSTSVSCL